MSHAGEHDAACLVAVRHPVGMFYTPVMIVRGLLASQSAVDLLGERGLGYGRIADLEIGEIRRAGFGYGGVGVRRGPTGEIVGTLDDVLYRRW